MTRASVGVVGISGYTGGELARLVASHQSLSLTAVAGFGSAGRTVGEVDPSLGASPIAQLTIGPPQDVQADLVFLATPHAESAALAPRLLERGARVVDLSGAFRLPPDAYPTWYGFEHPEPAWLSKAVYGLPERHRSEIASAALVANPGCFATAAVLALAPLVDEGAIDATSLLVDGKTGVSGAGRSASEAMSLAASAESVRPYAAPRHQHTPEIERALTAGGTHARVTFVPHLVPAVRGVLVTCYARLAVEATTASLTGILRDAYGDAPFVRVLAPGDMVDTRRVRGSNMLELQAFVDERSSMAVVVGALDNLLKGAAGQAVQNANVMLGLEEKIGLPLAGSVA